MARKAFFFFDKVIILIERVDKMIVKRTATATHDHTSTPDWGRSTSTWVENISMATADMDSLQEFLMLLSFFEI